MLHKLISTIISCHYDESKITDISLVVVDNDPEKSAEETVLNLKKEFQGSIKIEYHNYPVKGLSNVRNEILEKGLALNPDFIVFIDDDEHVTSELINELVGTIEANQGDMVMGPVIPEFEGYVPENISKWFSRPLFENNHRLDFVATNNLIIKTDTLLKTGVRFDPRFNLTGAEDSYFGIQMFRKGATCYWSSNAVVYDNVPAERANINWLIRRYFNGANTYTYILILDRQFIDLTLKIITSCFYIIAGILTIPVLLFPAKMKFWGVLKFSEGIGAIAALFRIKYYEYK